MEKLISKYIREILGFISFVSIILLTIYYGYSGVAVGEFISNKIILYFTYLFNPLVNNFSSLYRFLIIIITLIFSIVSLIDLIKQNKIYNSIIQFFVLNLVAFLLISIEFRYLIYVFGILLPLAIISVLNHISLISFKNKLESGVPINNIEKDFFDKLNLLIDKFLLLEDKKNVLKFESNYRELVKNYSTLSERSEKIAKSIKEFLLGILPRLQAEFANSNELIKSLRVEHSEVKKLQNKIEQLENGYAFSIIKNYIKQLIFMRNNLKSKFTSIGDDIYIDKLFSNFLSNFNILYTVFIPGIEFNPEKMEVISKVITEDINLDNKVESILAQAFLIDTGDKEKIIEKAQVKVYSFKKEEK
jgi:molecular chaperone GrpE (heat shock protein)